MIFVYVLIRHVVLILGSVSRMRTFFCSSALVGCSLHRRIFLSQSTKKIKFGLYVTNDENTVNVARTRGHFVVQLVTIKKYAQQKRSCAAGLKNLNFLNSNEL